MDAYKYFEELQTASLATTCFQRTKDSTYVENVQDNIGIYYKNVAESCTGLGCTRDWFGTLGFNNKPYDATNPNIPFLQSTQALYGSTAPADLNMSGSCTFHIGPNGEPTNTQTTAFTVAAVAIYNRTLREEEVSNLIQHFNIVYSY